MNRVLILGAGRSSSSLIQYLIQHAPDFNGELVVGDIDVQAARGAVGGQANASAVAFDMRDEESSKSMIASADVVISMMPPHLHPAVARMCLDAGKHLLTASYVSKEMKAFDADAQRAGLLFLNECGLDPGIDHMSAMMIIDRIRRDGGNLIGFESFTGGLIAPETDAANPWRYKFTWNPRNVVMAGQSTARFIEEGDYKYIPYQQLFQRTTSVHVPGLGDFEGYANRDSLSYKETYGLNNIRTLLRGTLRYQGFCEAWNALVQLGCCDDSFPMDNVRDMTHRDFMNAFLPYHPSLSVEDKLRQKLELAAGHPVVEKLRWSGLFDREPVGLLEGSPARVLECILNKRWKLEPDDKDMIVMWHRFTYNHDNTRREVQASLVAYGDNALHTAMARTVGLPLAIATRLLLQGSIKSRGVVIPVTEEIYKPVLAELHTLGIALRESE